MSLTPELIDTAAGAYLNYLVGRSTQNEPDPQRREWLKAGFELEWFLGYWSQHVMGLSTHVLSKYGGTVSPSERQDIHERAIELYYSRRMKERLTHHA